MKIVVSGAGGRMGRILTEKIRETEHILVGAVDKFAPPEGGVNAFAALREKRMSSSIFPTTRGLPN